MQNSSNRKRFNHIDLLKTIAIFLVISHHSSLFSVDLFSPNGFNRLAYFLRSMISTSIPVFFLVNGYLLFNRPFDLKNHVRRTLRLVFLVMIWSVILMPIYMFITGESFSLRTMAQSILNLSIPWAMNIYWFVGVLVCIYVFFPALKSLFDADRKVFKYFTVLCAFFVFGVDLVNKILGMLSTLSLPLPVTINYPLLTMFNPLYGMNGYTLFYFCFGGILYEYEDTIKSFSVAWKNAVAIVIVLLSCVIRYKVGVVYSIQNDGEIWDIVWNGFNSILTFFAVFCIFTLSLNYQKDIPLIREISSNSLGIYFTHELFIRSTRPLLFEIPQLCNIQFHLIYSLLIMIASLLLCLVLRKIPLLKKLV